MTKIKAFLFDIGNVLAHFDHEKSIRQLQSRSAATIDEVRTLVHEFIPKLETGALDSQEFLDTIRQKIGYKGDDSALSEAYCDIFWANLPMWELVDELHTRYPLYLFSNTSELHLQHLRDGMAGFAKFTDGIYSMRVGAMKPQPRIYQAVFDLLPYAPEEIFYIDDLPANIAQGRQCGLQVHQYASVNHQDLLADVRSKIG